jgi:hypothetical protein
MFAPTQRPLPDNTQQWQQTDIHAPGGIRTSSYSKQAASDLRLRRRGHWDRVRISLCFWRDSPQWARASSFTRFLDHTQRRTTFGRTPLDERSARSRDLYPIIHNIHSRQTSMPPVGFEPTTPEGERLQTYAVDSAAIGTGSITFTEM